MLVISGIGRDYDDSAAGQRRGDEDNPLSKVHTWQQAYPIHDQHATDRLLQIRSDLNSLGH